MGKKTFEFQQNTDRPVQKKKNWFLDTHPLCHFYFWTPVLETIASYETAETAELS